MKPTKIYSNNIEQGALDQFASAMEQEYSTQGALMPDAHQGYSLPIGAVVATEGVIVPAWVGYDIGCGMCAMPTSFKFDDICKNAVSIFHEIYRQVPVGFHVNEHAVESQLSRDGLSDAGKTAFDERKGLRGIGTLGGGNHFIEIGKDEEGTIWIIIHSGSRGVGHGIAGAYMRLASGDGKVREGHYPLGVDSELGLAYINDQSWALDYALENRMEIMRRVLNAIRETCTGDGWGKGLINRNHNHAELTDGLWIHRKGATHAEKDMMGVIPANMRDGTFIVRGLGNPESLCSSSHGAGRAMSRTKAKELLKMSDFIKDMEGITAKVCFDTLDESAEAYKDVHDVMRGQTELVEIMHHVAPIINIKG